MRKRVNKLIVYTHVGTHGSCVRLNNRAFAFHSLARTHEPCVPTCLLSTIHFIIQQIIKVKVQNSKFKVQNLKVQSSKFKVQSQNPYMPIAAIQQSNFSHFVV